MQPNSNAAGSGSSFGNNNTSTKESERVIIPNLLKWKERLENIQKPSLMTLTSLNRSKNQYADDNARRVTEILAKLVDLSLCSSKTLEMPSSSIGSSDYSDLGILENSMSVLRLLQSKDIFEAFFKHDLAKRLHVNRSASIDLERSLISMLKTEYGAGYTSEMEIWN